MGLDLMESFPTYLKSIRNMDQALGSLSEAPKWTIEGEIAFFLDNPKEKSD